MKTISVKKYKSSAIDETFDRLRSLEIDDEPFDSGSFGEVYICRSAGGRLLTAPLVLKLFTEDGQGGARRCYETVIALQSKMEDHIQYLRENNKKAIHEISALRALPQCSFEGSLGGISVLGYCASWLRRPDWVQFEEILNADDPELRGKPLNKFYNLRLELRLKMAIDLADGFLHLEQMDFVFADLNPQNFFVDMEGGRLCLIDYDGGAVEGVSETIGKPGEWMAPEIQAQLTKDEAEPVSINKHTDQWSVAVAIHFMFFNFHPLFFLKQRGISQMAAYLDRFEWPAADLSDENFNPELKSEYDAYVYKLHHRIPPALFRAFAETINGGYHDPARRLNYESWRTLLLGLVGPPLIHAFRADKAYILAGTEVQLSWDVENALALSIDNHVGEVTGRNSIRVFPDRNMTYHLTARGHFGEREAPCHIMIFPVPVLESLLVPMPDLDLCLDIGAIHISAPQFNHTVPFKPVDLSGFPVESLYTSTRTDSPPERAMGTASWSILGIFAKIKQKLNPD